MAFLEKGEGLALVDFNSFPWIEGRVFERISGLNLGQKARLTHSWTHLRSSYIDNNPCLTNGGC